jgi:sarcosine oxidase subunit gamma
MAERSPLAGFALPSVEGLRLAEVPFLAQLSLRLDARGSPVRAVEAALGLPLPLEPGTSSASGTTTALWLGPDEWLVIGPPRTGPELESRLRAAVDGGPAAVVDVSAQRTTILVAGAQARDLLAHGCPLDLHPSTFPVGRCAQTLLARARVIIAGVSAEPAYRVLVCSSYARYLAEWLVDAATEYLRG